jgi:hypothetical protein
VTALMVSAPSLNSGRNARPRSPDAAIAARKSSAPGTVTAHGWRSTGPRIFA